MIKKLLSIKEQSEILNELFGFSFENVSENSEQEHYVLFDEEGYEFYGSDANLKFNFSTLE